MGVFPNLEAHMLTSAVLEQKLRNYSALTKGDTILFIYNKKEYFLQVTVFHMEPL